MASADVASRPQERPRKRPIAQFIKNLTSRKNKSNDAQDKDKTSSKKNTITGSRNKRYFGNNGTLKNNPYPQSGHHLQQLRDPSLDSSANGNLSISAPSRPRSFDSARNTHSGPPTVATKSETIRSDAGNSKAATTTTRGGALSSTDGAGPDSTFSSPRNSQHSLSTTLTTIQSTSPGTTLQTAAAQPGGLPVMFSHQYPVSPAPSTANTISAIPRHLATDTYQSATANNLLSDNASILTLASSSKRRRRSMDTDASVRALAPRSEWGGSRESLPLSVLSGNVDAMSGQSSNLQYGPSRPSIGGFASAERASIYSNQGAGLAGERNSYYSFRPNRDLADAKSVRSITGLDSRSLAGDARSVNADAKSLGGDVASLKGGEGSIRSGAVGHSRNGSIPGSIGSPLTQRNGGGMSRRSSDWADLDRGDGGSDRKMSVDDQREERDDEDERRAEHA